MVQAETKPDVTISQVGVTGTNLTLCQMLFM